MRNQRFFVAIAAITVVFGAPSALWAQQPPIGATAPFAVLGGSAVTAAGPAGTVVDGSVGSSPTPAVSGFPPARVTAGHTLHLAANQTTADARTSATAARVALAARFCPAANIIAGGILGGRNLGPGTYCMPTGDLTGTLTLTGGAADIWVFQMTLDTLTTAGASRVEMAGGASSCNVYWQVSSSATLGGASLFRGSIYAGASIGVGTTANVVGRLIAGSGAVTMDGSNTVGGCSDTQPPGCPALTLSPTTLANGSVGVAYSQSFSLAGGATGSPVFTVAPGTLPPGLTLSSGGVLSGTPTTARPDTFTIRGVDALGCFALRTYTVVITDGTPPPAGCPVLTLSPPTLPNAEVGVPYSQQLTLEGAVGAVTFTRTAGDLLPAGLTLSSSGLISGTPTSPLSMTFTIRATDANGCFIERSFQIVGLAGVPTLPQAFVIVMLLGLLFIGYAQLRNRARV